jgi:uncharacterized protein GlcG (DUF336 family)
MRSSVVFVSIAASAVLLLGGSNAFAQSSGPSTLTKRTVTLEAANAMVNAAIAQAKVIGIPSTVAVYDESEILKALATMDGARYTTVNFALDKAYTAVRRQAATQDLADAFATLPQPGVLSFLKQPRLTLLGGGVPIIVDGQVVGGIGSSGGTIPQDIEVTNAGLAAFKP